MQRGASCERRAAGAGHRDLAATRPASASCAGTPCWPTRWRPVWTSTPGSAAWCPRWPAAPTWRRCCRPCAGRSTTAGVELSDVDAIAVTAGPGLAGALLVGVAAAKGYAVAAEKPLYGVNHLAAHVAVDTLEHGPLPEPAIALLVSGGHSSLLLVDDLAPAGSSRSAPPSTTRPARRTTRWPGCSGLPFPGGPPIDKAAARRRRGRDRLPARPDRRPRPGRAPVRLLLLRAEDGGRALGRGPRAGRRARCRWPTWRPASRRRSATC